MGDRVSIDENAIAQARLFQLSKANYNFKEEFRQQKFRIDKLEQELNHVNRTINDLVNRFDREKSAAKGTTREEAYSRFLDWCEEKWEKDYYLSSIIRKLSSDELEFLRELFQPSAHAERSGNK